MKKIKKHGELVLRFTAVLLSFVLLLSQTACKSKGPITADDFVEKVETLEYIVIDITHEYSQNPHILKALLCEDESA